MKILFINPPLLLSKDFIDYPYFANLGVLQNTAVLQQEGYKIDVLDFFSQKGSKCFALKQRRYYLGCSLKTGLSLIEKGKYDIAIVGLNAFLHPHTQNPYLRHLVTILKEGKKIPIIIFSDCYFGGMHYLDYLGDTISKHYPEVDYFIKYETEKALKDLVASIAKDSPLPQKFFYGNSSETFLDSLPHPAWNRIKMDCYFYFQQQTAACLDKKLPYRSDRRALPIVATRGCKYKCIFCANSIRQDGFSAYRKYSIDYLRNYIMELKKEYAIEGLAFLDNTANLDAGYFGELLTLLNEECCFYDFPNGLRADRLKMEQLRLMKNKITSLSISAESGNQKTVDEIMLKKQNLESVEKVASWCKTLKIPLLVHYMIGFPWENIREINDTLKHATRIHKKYNVRPAIQYANPLPGTKLEQMCKKAGALPYEQPHDYDPFFTKKYLISHPKLSRGQVEKMKQLFRLRLKTSTIRKVIVNLTYRCNNRCIFCAVGDREKVSADREVVKEDLRRFYAEGVRWLDIDGGEPTLHGDLLSLICYARSLGYEQINVTTNGRLLSREKFAQSLLDSGITSLLISLHGHNEKIHSKHTQHPESFKQTVSAIKNVVKLRTQSIDFGVNTAITKFNYSSLPEFIECVQTLGVPKVNIQFLTPFGRAAKDMVPPMNEAVALLKRVLDTYGKRMEIQVVNMPPCYLNGYEKYAMADFLKAERNMIFIPHEEVNLADYLGDKRTKTSQCNECVYDIVCGGLYQFRSINTQEGIQCKT